MAIILQFLCACMALALALAFPRAGDAALLVPIGAGSAQAGTILWSARENADLLGSSEGRIVVVIPSTASAFRAIAAGLLPVAADPALCSDSSGEGARPQ